jgi:hypothetical protein
MNSQSYHRGRKTMASKTKRPGKQKGATHRETGSRRENEPRTVAPLEFNPFKPGSEHPAWVMKDFPSYVEHTHEALVRSTRVLEHRGNAITITTTYEVRVNERLVTLHMMVDEEGRLWSHLCPYLTFATATELVRHLIARMPHLFEPAPPSPGSDEEGDSTDHGQHAHHVAHARGGGR